MITYIIVATIAYLLGSISFSVIISKKMAGFDVRQKGSGNAGTTNVLRSVGKKSCNNNINTRCTKRSSSNISSIYSRKNSKRCRQKLANSNSRNSSNNRTYIPNILWIQRR